MEGTYFKIDSNLEKLRHEQDRIEAFLDSQSLKSEYDQRFEISWIYHDSALEGVVLTYSEIKASIDNKIISDVSLIPSYQEIKQFKSAIEWIHEYAQQKRKPIDLDTAHALYGILEPEEAEQGAPYRKDNPLHRLYYHEIAAPEKIAARMKKLGEWMADEEKRMHPIQYAAQLHHRFMAIFPWLKHSGRVARLMSNLILLRNGYLPALIHAIDRQRYYECLKGESAMLVPLYLEAESTSVETAIKFRQETLDAASDVIGRELPAAEVRKRAS